MNWRKKLRLLIIFIILGFMIAPAFADETTIELNQETPYVDVPVSTEQETIITIETTTGTPQTNSGFIDSWIELWQDTTRLAFNDDGAHSGTNVLASFLEVTIQAGTYFIRATSYANICCQATPTGNYLLTWNGVTTITSPSPTPSITPTEEPTATPAPSPTETQTVEPTPTPTEIITPSPEPTLQPPVEPATPVQETQQPIVVPSIPVTQSATPEPEPTNLLEPMQQEQLQTESTPEPPITEIETIIEPIQQQIDQKYIEQNTIELQIPTALENIPGLLEVFQAAETIMNVGSDMTYEQREESQTVVVAAVVLTQISQMASITTGAIRRERFKK